MGVLKKCVRNRTRPEGSIASAYGTEEVMGVLKKCFHRRRRRPEPRPHAAAQSPDQPTGDPPEHRRRRNALAGAAIPCSPSTRRYLFQNQYVLENIQVL